MGPLPVSELSSKPHGGEAVGTGRQDSPKPCRGVWAEDRGCHRGVISKKGTCHPERWLWGLVENEWVEVVGGKFKAGRPLLGSRGDSGG